MRLFLGFYLLCLSTVLPQSADTLQTQFELFPAGLNFMPLKANHQEARTGVLYYPDNANLKVDVGNSIDLLRLTSPNNLSFGAGLEFMAYAKSTSYKGNRLQIDALDGFFGGNLSLVQNVSNGKFMLRARYIHNSAHLVDGSYDKTQDKWIYKEPIPFTKNFGELTIAHELDTKTFSLKYFGGISYNFMVRPEIIKKFGAHLGFEFALLGALGQFLNIEGDLFAAHYFFLNGIEKYQGNSQSILGIKLGNWYKKGAVIYLSYYSGSDIFSSYYDRNVSKFGMGFQVDF